MTVENESPLAFQLENALVGTRNPLLSFLYDAISSTDLIILSVIMSMSQKRDTNPTVKDIQKILTKTKFQLKRTQLYDRLNKLRESGFIHVHVLQYPRRYQVDERTLIQGTRYCIEKRRHETATNLSNLQKELDAMDCINPRSIASLLIQNMMDLA